MEFDQLFGNLLRQLFSVVFPSFILCSQILAMVDCGGRIFNNRHGQSVKDGGAMVFFSRYGGLEWKIFGFPRWSAIHNR
jgi:hypothetical protein